jgi:hypothetical protein
VFNDEFGAAILGAVRGRLFNGCEWLALLIGLTLALGGIVRATASDADHTAHLASQLSDNAFSLLSSINTKDSGSPLADPVANFAADAQTLSQMLDSGDRPRAASQMSTLIADRAAVDSAIKGSSEAGLWGAIKHELDVLAEAIPPSQPKPSAMRTSVSPGNAVESGKSATASIPAELVRSEATSASTEHIGPMPSTSSSTAPPKAVIESSSDDGGVLRIKGYLEGTALTGGGIYQNGQLLKPIKIDTIQGEQRLDFDIGLGSPEPGMSIRVYDAQGRSAEAFASAPEGGRANLEPGNSTISDEGVEVDRSRPAEAPEENAAIGTAEIPSHGSTRPSPSKRHTLESHLGDVQIDVVAIRQIAVTPPMYEVLGVIQGRDVTRAGIYIDGRLAAQIPSSSSAAANNIDQRFVMDGRAASIRAFGVGNHYAEQPIDLSTAIAAAAPPVFSSSMMGPPVTGGPSVISGAPANAVTGTMSIQIQSVTSLSPTQTVVTGVINGRNVRTAGLYQSGMLDQTIPVGGASGASGLLGSVLSHFGTQTVPFTAYYNPANGPAVIRVTDSTGAYAEQAIGLGGVNAYLSAPSAATGIGSRPPAGSW